MNLLFSDHCGRRWRAQWLEKTRKWRNNRNLLIKRFLFYRIHACMTKVWKLLHMMSTCFRLIHMHCICGIRIWCVLSVWGCWRSENIISTVIRRAVFVIWLSYNFAAHACFTRNYQTEPLRFTTLSIRSIRCVHQFSHTVRNCVRKHYLQHTMFVLW